MREMLKKTLTAFLIVCLIGQPVWAATLVVGSSTHTYTSSVPIHFSMTSSVSYSKLSGHEMEITSFTNRMKNFTDSQGSLIMPEFVVENSSYYHTTYSRLYAPLSYPANSTWYSITCNWTNFISTYYPSYYSSKGTTYAIPANASDNSEGMDTQSSINVEASTGAYLTYNYTTYWRGDGTYRVLDRITNTPTWRTGSTSTLTNSEMSEMRESETITCIPNLRYDKDNDIYQVEVIYEGFLDTIPSDAELYAHEDLRTLYIAAFF